MTTSDALLTDMMDDLPLDPVPRRMIRSASGEANAAGRQFAAELMSPPATRSPRMPPRPRRRTAFGDHPPTLYDRVEAFVSKLSMRDNFWNSICSLIWLPLAFFSGIRLKEIDVNTYMARAVLPFRRFNRNWYRAMAGGALLANSEIAGGSYVFGICGGDYTVVCKHLDYKFLRPCLGPAVYRIKAREDIKSLMVGRRRVQHHRGHGRAPAGQPPRRARQARRPVRRHLPRHPQGPAQEQGRAEEKARPEAESENAPGERITGLEFDACQVHRRLSPVQHQPVQNPQSHHHPRLGGIPRHVLDVVHRHVPAGADGAGLRLLGWVVFAVPNVVGAAAMGWVLRDAAASERVTADHPTACAAFSAVTILFQIMFVGGVVRETDRRLPPARSCWPRHCGDRRR